MVLGELKGTAFENQDPGGWKDSTWAEGLLLWAFCIDLLSEKK